jgi:predicted restriction endonuclease
MFTERRPWAKNELLVVFRLYSRTPFGKLHQRNPEIIELARILHRTPGAVAMKACNFASLDPQQRARHIKALGNVSRADKELWDAFLDNSETLAQDAEAAFFAACGKDADEYLPELGPVREPAEGKTHEKQESSYGEFEMPQGETVKEMLVKARRVQSFFRAAVLASYEHRCALTGLAIYELLNASHIIPWSVDEKRRADPRNGICLNALHDRAFDRGFITFDVNLRVVVSPELSKSDISRIHREHLIDIADQQLRLPTRFQPDPSALEYHRQRIFRK